MFIVMLIIHKYAKFQTLLVRSGSTWGRRLIRAAKPVRPVMAVHGHTRLARRVFFLVLFVAKFSLAFQGGFQLRRAVFWRWTKVPQSW